jgi:hypothetical protein
LPSVEAATAMQDTIFVKPGRILIALSLVLGGCVAPPSQEGPPPGPGNQVVNSSGECLDVEGGGASDGTPLILFHCHGSANQSWTITNSQIVGIGGSCVDVQGSAPIDGSPAILVRCDGVPSQRWNVVNGNIVGIGAKCLDVLGEQSSDRSPVILAPCAGRPSEQWAVR